MAFMHCCGRFLTFWWCKNKKNKKQKTKQNKQTKITRLQDFSSTISKSSKKKSKRNFLEILHSTWTDLVHGGIIFAPVKKSLWGMEWELPHASRQFWEIMYKDTLPFRKTKDFNIQFLWRNKVAAALFYLADTGRMRKGANSFGIGNRQLQKLSDVFCFCFFPLYLSKARFPLGDKWRNLAIIFRRYLTIILKTSVIKFTYIKSEFWSSFDIMSDSEGKDILFLQLVVLV